MKKENFSLYTLLGIIILITIFNVSLVYYVFQYKKLGSDLLPNLNLPDFFQNLGEQKPTASLFASADDFKSYLAKSPEEDMYYGGGIRSIGVAESAPSFGVDNAAGLGTSDKTAVPAPGRVSETNVQVTGIDEPDIVKTDGQEIYFSSSSFINGSQPEPMPLIKELPLMQDFAPDRIMPPYPYPNYYGGTKTIKAWPPADLKVEANLNEQGNLLIKNNILVIFTSDQIIGYDVTDKAKPNKKWSVDIQDNNWQEAARLYDDKIYLITRTTINRQNPCPIRPLNFNGQELSIACTEIYHPNNAMPVNSTFSVIVIDSQNGEVKNKTAFVGTSGNSIIYMSADSIYITYTYLGDTLQYLLGFFQENRDLVPDWFITRLAKVASYDISNQAKMMEVQLIFSEWQQNLTSDDRLKIENEFANRSKDFSKKHRRDLEKSGIAKISVQDLKLTATGNVPGSPLNQFALDEYQGNLRIATTSGQNFYVPFMDSGESANDVYVLDKNLNEIGSVTDMGLTERIYSVRFIEDKGYVVTFRQTDPFYVLDLSKPSQPELKGELKIPGYSAYLHPINKDKIIGIGEENGQVKISLFDVSNSADPKEIAKYNLADYYSEISQTHHAFLLDDKHKIFFLPGSRGGYIFGYENDQLTLKRAISDVQARRALYIEDYLYIVGEQSITVINEKDWQDVNKMQY